MGIYYYYFFTIFEHVIYLIMTEIYRQNVVVFADNLRIYQEVHFLVS